MNVLLAIVRALPRPCLALVLLAVLLVGKTAFVSARVIEFVPNGQTLDHLDSYGVAMGDVNGDGRLDIVIANFNGQGNRVWLNDGAGQFHDSGQILGAQDSSGVALADIDGDGDRDAIFANYNGQGNSVWVNNGQGIFTDSGQSLGNSNSQDVAAGDIDGDGDLDLVFANDVGQANTVWRNNGAGVFTDSGQRLGLGNSRSVVMGDLNGDGQLDLFFANQNNEPDQVWLNDGAGRFSDSGQRLGNVTSLGAALGDLDGDGDLDVFITTQTGGNEVWFNDGSGNFTDSGQRLGNVMSRDVALGDLDGDGDLDAFVVNAFGQADTVWFNNGRGFFRDSGQGLGNADGRRVFLGDVDGDRDLDAVVVNALGQSNTIWLNQAELILTLKPGRTIRDIEALLTANQIVYTRLFDDTRGNLPLKAMFGITRTYLLTPTASTDIEALRQVLTANSNVETCSYNQYLYFDALPNDYTYKQMNLDKIGLTTLWKDRSPFTEPSDVRLAILDSAVDATHEDLQANIAAGKDCTTINPATNQCEAFSLSHSGAQEHGTLVAGLAAAVTNNARGIASVAGNCRILPVTVGETITTLDHVFRAVEAVVDGKFAGEYATVVINASFSNSITELGAKAVALFQRWIRYAYLSNVPIVASMGNNGWNVPHYPAAFAETIAVGATDSNNAARWIHSNYGDWIALVAPGVNILSTAPQNKYAGADGTSMAAPHVTGVIGLLLAQQSAYTIEELRSLLKDTALRLCLRDQCCPRDQCGAGLLNAANAVALAESHQHLALNLRSYDFGNVPPGASATVQITLNNPCAEKTLGTIAPVITSFAEDLGGVGIVAPNPADFRVAGQPQCQQTAAGETCAFDVTFAPQSAGVTAADEQAFAEVTIPTAFFSCATTISAGKRALTVQLKGTVSEPPPSPTAIPSQKPVVPEPATLFLLGSGLIFIFALARKRMRR